MIGVNAAKEAVRQRLLVDEPGPGYCHFPTGRPDNWYAQLTSEELRIERKGGVEQRHWKLKKGIVNEALDCRVYAYAALHELYQAQKLNLEKAAESLRAHSVEFAMQEHRGKLEIAPQQSRRRVRRSSFML